MKIDRMRQGRRLRKVGRREIEQEENELIGDLEKAPSGGAVTGEAVGNGNVSRKGGHRRHLPFVAMYGA